MSGAYVFFSVLILITSVLLVLVVLVQNSKGGGLASNFASSNQFMGVRKTADLLEKTTWTLAIILLVFSLVSIFVIPRGTGIATQAQSELKEKIENVPAKPVKDFSPAPKQEGQNKATQQPQQNQEQKQTELPSQSQPQQKK